MSAICKTKNELTKTKINLDQTTRHKQEGIQYAGGRTVGDMWLDVAKINNNFVDGILWGAKWTNLPDNTLKYTVNYGTNGPDYAVNEYNNDAQLPFIEPNANALTNVDVCMTDLGKLIGIPVQKVTDVNDAILSFNFVAVGALGTNVLGMAMPPTPSNDVWYDSDKLYTSISESLWCAGNIYMAYNTSHVYDKGGFYYGVLVHELGHAIGLAHPHDTGGNSEVYDGVTSSSEVGTYSANQHPMTTMTYNDLNSNFVPDSSSNTSGFLATFGPIDVVALQLMYGANTSSTADTTYTFPVNASENFWETIWDNGGTDTIDASGVSFNLTIDLNDATIDNTYLAGTKMSAHNNVINEISVSSSLYGGFTIAKNATIENVITCSGNNTIVGNEADNQITVTGGGDDDIDGGSGYDTVIINNVKSAFTITDNYNVDQTVTLNDGSNTVTLRHCEKIIFNDQEMTFGSILSSDLSAVEFGSVDITHEWSTVNISGSFTTPVVIASDSTLNGGQPVCVRIRNISGSSFDIRLVEPSNLDGSHVTEQISYIIGEQGIWDIDGTQIEFNLVSSSNKTFNTFESITFSNSFESTPVILSQIQSYANPEMLTIRTKDISTSGFELTIQRQESLRDSPLSSNESIGWIAIPAGSLTNNSKIIRCATESDVTHLNKQVNYSSSFDHAPYLITKLASSNGGDPANTRIISNTISGFQIKIQEDTSRDSETNHIQENICYLAGYTDDLIHAPVVIPSTNLNAIEFGSVNINHEWTSVTINGSFTNPVVIASDSSLNGGQPVSVRIRNLTASSFDIKLHEPSNLDGTHVIEQIDYFIGEKGSWQIDDTVIEFGNFSTNKLYANGFTNVSFTNSITSPSVVTQIQTYNDSDYLLTRTKDISASSFSVTMQKEERLRTRTTTSSNETVGWFAIDSGTLNNSSKLLENNVVSSVTHLNKAVNYTNTFLNSPYLITKLGSSNGGDPANTRIVQRTTGGFTVKIQEDTSKDSETNHINENVYYVALNLPVT